MIARLKRLVFKTRLRLTNNYIKRNKLLRKVFWHIGENVHICTDYFGAEPYLVWIEDDVIVAGGVRFINHDASCWNMYRYLGIESKKSDEKIGSIILRKNCFIGINAILLPNTEVGENSVIAAGAVVKGKVPANEVWGGVPAKFIMTVDEYSKKIDNYKNSLPWRNIETMNSEELKRVRQNLFADKI